MLTKKQKQNARRIVELADRFGSLHYNKFGQTPEGSLNLSVPCARLVVAGVVTGVADTNDGINDNAVADMEATCRAAVDYVVANGSGDSSFRRDLIGAAASLLDRPSELERGIPLPVGS